MCSAAPWTRRSTSWRYRAVASPDRTRCAGSRSAGGSNEPGRVPASVMWSSRNVRSSPIAVERARHVPPAGMGDEPVHGAACARCADRRRRYTGCRACGCAVWAAPAGSWPPRLARRAGGRHQAGAPPRDQARAVRRAPRRRSACVGADGNRGATRWGGGCTLSPVRPWTVSLTAMSVTIRVVRSERTIGSGRGHGRSRMSAPFPLTSRSPERSARSRERTSRRSARVKAHSKAAAAWSRSPITCQVSPVRLAVHLTRSTASARTG